MKDLITCMLTVDPSIRFGMQDILAHEWVNQSVATDTELQEYLAPRHKAIKEAHKQA